MTESTCKGEKDLSQTVSWCEKRKKELTGFNKGTKKKSFS